MPKMSFQWFFDLSTIKDRMQKITVYAGGTDVIRRLSPQFAAYKYFKLGKVKLSMSPASSLPIDPTGLSYEAGENTVDPRDQLTPGLVRITNGEKVGNIPNIGAHIHEFYNQMILDRRWYKFSMQSGLKKSAVPLFWSVGMTKQYPFPGANINAINDVYYSGEHLVQSGKLLNRVETDNVGNVTLRQIVDEGAVEDALVQTGNNIRLGWLPTDTFVQMSGVQYPSLNDVPAVPCFTVLLPPAYKTKYYFRCYVTETVYFKDAVTNYYAGTFPNNYHSLDRFVAPGQVKQSLPGAGDGLPTEPTFKVNASGQGD